MKNFRQRKQDSPARSLRMSVMLFLIALVSITAASVAWMSLTDHGEINTMKMELTTGKDMKFDLDAHKSIEQYTDELSFGAIAGRISSEQGFNPKTTPLIPVTTEDEKVFTYEDGAASSDNKGDYLTFKLHFMAEEDMSVHLTADDEDKKSGTVIDSTTPGLKEAMRISFTDGEDTYIYDPGIGDSSTTAGNTKTFGLKDGSTDLNKNNKLFELKSGVDKEITVHIWLEGTDENCKDNLKGSDYSIAMKFRGSEDDVVNRDQKMHIRNSENSNGPTDEDEESDTPFWDSIVENMKEIISNHK